MQTNLKLFEHADYLEAVWTCRLPWSYCFFGHRPIFL